jgi:hypothetical protein
MVEAVLVRFAELFTVSLGGERLCELVGTRKIKQELQACRKVKAFARTRHRQTATNDKPAQERVKSHK